MMKQCLIMLAAVLCFSFTFLFTNTAIAADDYDILVEVDLGFNIFNVMAESELSYKSKASGIDSSSTEDMSLDMSPGFLLLAGYDKKNYALGGEIGSFKYEGEFENDVKLKSSSDGGDWDDYDYYSLDGSATLKKDKSQFDLSIFHIGPFGRYYFQVGNEKLRPFVGGALGYNMCSIKHNKGDKMDFNAVNVSAFGGVLYKVHKNIQLGGSGRLDYYYPTSDAEDDDFLTSNDKWKETITIVPFSILFNAAFVF